MSKPQYYLAKCLPRTSDLLSFARRILRTGAALAVLAGLNACSLLSSDTSTSILLEPLQSQGSWQRVQASPYVYRSTDSQQAFLTGIRDCKSARPPSPAVAARQLLVGLKEIRIEEQRQVQLADLPALHSRIRARLEELPLDMETVTLTHRGCVYDFVLWRSAPEYDFSEPASPTLLDDGKALSEVLALRITEILQSADAQ